MKKSIIFILVSLFLFPALANAGECRRSDRSYYQHRSHSLWHGYKGEGYYDYWYYTTLEGKLTTEGIPVSKGAKDNKYEIDPGLWVRIAAVYDDDGDEVVDGIHAEAQGTGSADIRKD